MIKPDLSLKISSSRIWELDFIKGISILIMIMDHILFDLSSMYGVDTTPLGFIDSILSPIAAISFMIICGISVTFGKKNIKRGFWVFCFGMIISLVTFIAGKVLNDNLLICFGILHFLGIGMIVGHYIKKFPIWIIVLLIPLSFALSILFSRINPSTNVFFALGIYNGNFFSADYFPVFPNLAYICIGITLGKTVYKKKKSIFSFSPEKSIVCCLGRNTLLIYMMHQPLILALIALVFTIIR